MDKPFVNVSVSVQEGLEFQEWKAFVQGFSEGVSFACQQAIDRRWKQFQDRHVINHKSDVQSTQGASVNESTNADGQIPQPSAGPNADGWSGATGSGATRGASASDASWGDTRNEPAQDGGSGSWSGSG